MVVPNRKTITSIRGSRAGSRTVWERAWGGVVELGRAQPVGILTLQSSCLRSILLSYQKEKGKKKSFHVLSEFMVCWATFKAFVALVD